MKKIYRVLLLTITAICFIINPLSSQDTTYFLTEDFEEGALPSGWKNEQGGEPWSIQMGGDDVDVVTNQLSRQPPTDHTKQQIGDGYNATYPYLTTTLGEETTKLITPEINFEFAIKPQLNFWHAQYPREITPGQWQWSILKVYYRHSEIDPWTFIKEYNDSTTSWVERSILLPDSATNSYYLAFEGYSSSGHGTCIDDIAVFETGILQRRMDTILAKQPSTADITSGSIDNPIIRLNMKVFGNTGTITFDSIALRSLNTNDEDIAAVKLFATEETSFNTSNPIGSPATFDTNGFVAFNNLNHELSTGPNYIWVTYDAASTVKHGNYADIKIEPYSISVNDTLYPASEISPSGKRRLIETIYLDRFDTISGWTFTGEFERGVPKGLGGSGSGFADPDTAYSDTMIIGTDVTGADTISNGDTNHFPGDYEREIGQYADQAISPLLPLRYFNKLSLDFRRWLNIENSDRAYIDVSNDNGKTWENVWRNFTFFFENNWAQQTLDISDVADKQDSVRIRFALGPTDTINHNSGWNIDNFMITGNFVENDISISEWISPLSGCGHTTSDTVKVRITNLGGLPSKDTIPIMYSFSGAVTKTVVDTFFGVIPVEGDTIFTFDETIDLSKPYFYKKAEIYRASLVPDDEETKNDTVNTELFVVPTHVAPFETDFEDGFGFWREFGNNLTWEWGIPEASLIDSAASGNNVWGINLDGNYPNKDSSIIVSPCFDLSNIKRPVIEFKYWSEYEDSVDGFTVQYTEDGINWHDIDTHNYDFKWNWHNNDSIIALGTYGWDTSTTTYLTARQFLPKSLAYAPYVRFRFFNAADHTSIRNGVAIDDFKLYSAPFDIGVDSIVHPKNACELSFTEKIKVAVTNYAIDTIYPDDTLMMAFHVNDSMILDTFTLNKKVAVNDTFYYSSSKGFNMYQSGTYAIKAYPVSRFEDDIYADTIYDNDTAKASVSVYKPYIEFGGDIFTCHPDTIVLNGYAGANNQYAWQKTPDPDTLSTDTILAISEQGEYHVHIVNDSTGCTAQDTVEVIRLIADIGVSGLTYPQSSCELSDSVPVGIEITNFGTDTIRSDYHVVATYVFESMPPVIDTFWIADTVYPDSTYIHYFDSVVDMSVMDTFYTFKAYTDTILTSFKEDESSLNDTSSVVVNVWGYPDFNLQPNDTLHVGFTYTLNARKGDTTYKSFVWEDNSTDSIFTVDTIGYGNYYSVTVADVHNCPAWDSSWVKLIIPDVAVTDILNPDSVVCGDITNDSVSVKIKNVGTDTIRSDSIIPVVYQIDSDPLVLDTLTLNQPFYPGDSLLFSFSEALNMAEGSTYGITAYTNLARDSIKSNDTTAYAVKLYSLPTVELDYGEDDTTYYDIAEYTLDAGSGFTNYLWHNNDTNQTFTIRKATFTPDNKYSVTVTDTNTCQASDTVKIKLIYSDLDIISMNIPDSLCGITKDQPIELTLQNTGTRTLISNNVNVNRSVNNTNIQESFNIQEISDSITPTEYFNFKFDSSVIIANEGSYDFEFSLEMTNDIIESNDTLINTVFSKGKPLVKWDDPLDTIYVRFPHSLELDSSYANYLWQDNSTDSIYSVDTEAMYYITVENSYGCSASDSIYVFESFFDIEVISTTLPDTTCSMTPGNHIQVTMNNSGTRVLKSNQVDISYSVNQANIVKEVFHIPDISDSIEPGEMFSYTFDSASSIFNNGTYNYHVIANLDQDSVYLNDTLKKSVYIHGLPVIEWTPKTDTVTESFPYELTLDKTYDSYMWSTDSTSSSIIIDSINWYYLTVTDINACSYNDSIFVRNYYDDISVTKLLIADSICGFGDSQNINVQIKNTGTNFLTSNIVNIYYNIDQKGMVEESFTISSITGSNLIPGRKLTYSFDSVDITKNNGLHQIEVMATMNSDIYNANDTLKKQLYFHGIPSITWETTNDTLKTDYPHSLSIFESYPNYLWSNNSTNASIQIDENGWYALTVTDNNQCSASDSIYIQAMGIEELAEQGIQINIFPNPADEYAVIEIQSDQSNDYIIKIISADKKILNEFQVDNKAIYSKKIDLSSFSPGIYYLLIRNKKGNTMRKIIIE